jgi:hypothetical protein
MSTPGAAPTLKQATDALLPFKASQVGMSRQADLDRDIADATRGSGASGMFEYAKRSAFERLRAAGKTYGEYDASNQSNLYQGQLLDEIQRDAFERAKKVGVDTSQYGEYVDNPIANFARDKIGYGSGTGVLGGRPLDRFRYPEKDRAAAYAELEAKIGAAGGNGVNNEAVLAKLDEQTEVMTQTRDAIISGLRQNNKPGPKAPPALPAVPAARVGR